MNINMNTSNLVFDTLWGQYVLHVEEAAKAEADAKRCLDLSARSRSEAAKLKLVLDGFIRGAAVAEGPIQVIEGPIQVIEEPIQVIEEPIQVIEEPIQVIEEPIQVIEEPIQVIEEPNRSTETMTAKLITILTPGPLFADDVTTTLQQDHWAPEVDEDPCLYVEYCLRADPVTYGQTPEGRWYLNQQRSKVEDSVVSSTPIDLPRATKNKKATNTKVPPADSIRGRVAKILLDYGPTSRADVVAELEARNQMPESKDIFKYVSVILSSHAEFSNCGGGRWTCDPSKVHPSILEGSQDNISCKLEEADGNMASEQGPVAL
jgi:hypothetical protein